jgi:hypothetical protein
MEKILQSLRRPLMLTTAVPDMSPTLKPVRVFRLAKVIKYRYQITAMRVTVGIPAYNEEHNILNLLQSIVDNDDSLVGEIIASDYSSDDTPRIVRRFAQDSRIPVVHFHHPKRRGRRRRGTRYSVMLQATPSCFRMRTRCPAPTALHALRQASRKMSRYVRQMRGHSVQEGWPAGRQHLSQTGCDSSGGPSFRSTPSWAAALQSILPQQRG